MLLLDWQFFKKLYCESRHRCEEEYMAVKTVMVMTTSTLDHIPVGAQFHVNASAHDPRRFEKINLEIQEGFPVNAQRCDEIRNGEDRYVHFNGDTVVHLD